MIFNKLMARLRGHATSAPVRKKLSQPSLIVVPGAKPINVDMVEFQKLIDYYAMDDKDRPKVKGIPVIEDCRRLI